MIFGMGAEWYFGSLLERLLCNLNLFLTPADLDKSGPRLHVNIILEVMFIFHLIFNDMFRSTLDRFGYRLLELWGSKGRQSVFKS